jgi:hypothetical protein
MRSLSEIAKRIGASTPCLGQDLVDLGYEALVEHEGQRYTNCVLRAASFIEGLLLRVHEASGLQPDARPSFGTLIGTLRASKRFPIELLDRPGAANAIRNRAAHAQPNPMSVIS